MDMDREGLRALHQVRSLTDAEDGNGIHRLPGGVYGFTYAPGLPDTPLFREIRRHCFEVHKLGDDSVALVGFLSQELAERLETGLESMSLELVPDAGEQASTLVSIPLSRVVNRREHSIREKGALSLQIAPVTAAC